MKKYFYLDESPMYKEKFLLRLNYDLIKFPNGTKGSYAVFISRILGLSYPDYLRFARDVLGAEIIGKGKKYPICFFNRSNELDQFVKMINKQMEKIDFDCAHPYDIIEDENKNLKKVNW